MNFVIQDLHEVVSSVFAPEAHAYLGVIARMAVIALALVPPLPQAAPPKEEAGKIVFELYNLRFEVDPSLAGRVVSFKLAGEEILTVSGGDLNRGSTFWPSPQTWGWPPPAVLDKSPYSGGIAGDSVVLSSGQDGSGLKFRKTYRADSAETCIVVRYTIINGKGSPVSVAGWEVTRLPKTGITFWLKGEGEPTGSLVPMAVHLEGATWLPWQNPRGSHKIFADAAGGWLAHVNAKGEFLIKKFKDSPFSKRAPNENEIEVFLGGGYFELEHQGPYTEIAPNDSTHWEVRWYARKRFDLAIEVGNKALLDYVDSIVNPAPVSSSRVQPVFHRGIPARPGLRIDFSGGFPVSGPSMNIKGQSIPRPLPRIQVQVLHQARPSSARPEP